MGVREFLLGLPFEAGFMVFISEKENQAGAGEVQRVICSRMAGKAQKWDWPTSNF